MSDLDKTQQFFAQLGFDMQKADDAVRVKLGDFTLAFVDEQKTLIQNESGKKLKGLGVYTYVEVDDVDRYFEMIKKNGVAPRTEPKTWPWGKREFVVKDPDGYTFVFYSYIKK
ncbi:MAG TPA: VOC family protein [Candidatus Paceibacterota bacterium]